MARTTRTPFLGSLSLHIVVLVALISFRGKDAAPTATDTAPRVTARIVYLHSEGAGGGGGGGGQRDLAPVRRAESRGADNASVPITPPPDINPAPLAPPEDVSGPVLSAVPMGAATAFAPGLIDPERPREGSQGAGTDDGAGSGRRGGDGSDAGVGLGPGANSGTGSGVYEPGGGVRAPVPVRMIRPQYTSAAMSARLSGVVVVRCVVMPDGSVGDVQIVRSLDARLGLDEEAVKAARLWRFQPGTLEGQPVPVAITIQLSFSIY
jgi:protein TonB